MAYKTTSDHWNMILSYMEENREFAMGKSNRELYRKMWNELTEQLNAIGNTKKSVEKWQKAWTDFKFGLKKKVLKLAVDSADCKPFSDVELKVLSILGDSLCKGYNKEECISNILSHSISKPRKRTLSMCGLIKTEREEMTETPDVINEAVNELEENDEDNSEYYFLKVNDMVDEIPEPKRAKLQNDDLHQETVSMLQTINDTIDHRLLGIQRSIDKLTNVIKYGNPNRDDIAKVADNLLATVNCLVKNLEKSVEK